jgi:signal transduction histidine kinase
MTEPTAAPAARVLVVDDNAALVENLAEILVETGYTVRPAGSYRDAVKAAQAPFDIALVDVQLPDGDGMRLAADLKESHPESEVVLLTGFASVESAAAAVRAGACAYLVKPCATPELLLTVGQAHRQVRLHAEKRELARRAQMMEKLAAVGTLTAGLSHEIRNPLNAAGLQLTVLERRIKKLPDDTQAPLLDPLTLVRDEIRRLDHILEDFLQFARPREFTPTPVDIGGLTERIVDFLRGDTDRRGVSLSAQMTGCAPVAGDEGRLRQVLMNLSLNAIDAAGPGGKVSLSARSGERDVTIFVDDSGRGVPPELRERIFEPFFTTKASGSGLGLPIVNAIVIQHGGSVSVEAGPLGGARFNVKLPRAAG